MTVQEIDKQIENLKFTKRILEQHITPDDNIDTIIYKKYIELENITNVMKYINEKKYYKEVNGRLLKYNITDISNAIKNKEADVENNIKELAKQIFKEHKKGAKRRW